jgi:hypothetical protein
LPTIPIITIDMIANSVIYAFLSAHAESAQLVCNPSGFPLNYVL